MAATAKDFPNTSWQNVTEPVSSAPGAGKVGFTGGAIGAGGINLGDLSNITRFAGSLGGLLGGGGSIEDIMKDTLKYFKKESKRTTKKTDKRIENIYPGLTEQTAADAIKQYKNEFANTIANIQAQGRADLGIDPNLGTQVNRLNTRVQDIQNQYSLAGRLGGYEQLALDPAVVSMDISGIRSAADWTAPEIAAQYGMLTDYSGPQASRFIYGGGRTADAIGRYYNTSGDVAGLMNYGTLA